MGKFRLFSLLAAAFVIGGAIWALEAVKPSRSGDPAGGAAPSVVVMDKKEKIALYEPAKELVDPQGYINAGNGIRLADLIGKKVILLDFWTYSCINCQRTIPYLNAWYEKYRDKGLEIIGVHTPEFEFEKDYSNVSRAVEKFGIRYPVAQDNDYRTWNAYGNRYWPRKYLIDIDGFIVYDHIGEGGYEETERKIQELLNERAAVLNMKEKIGGDPVKPSGAYEVESGKVGSPEVYFGATRNEYLANGRTGVAGLNSFEAPGDFLLNRLYLSGSWDIRPEYAENKNAGSIFFRYRAKNVYFVASSPEPVKIKVLRDGKLYRELTIREDQLYSLIEDSVYGEHLLEIRIEGAGLKAFAFTFG